MAKKSQYRRSSRHRYQKKKTKRNEILKYCLNTAEAVDIGTN